MLFTDRSIWTMVHGIALGGAALMGLSAALFYLYAAQASDRPQDTAPNAPRAFASLTVFTALMLWLTVVVGTYIVFPPYRATPPSGATDLSPFPRALVLASPDTAWLHAFAMETVVILNEAGIFAAPAVYGAAGGVSGRTTLATVIWLVAWGLLHHRWKDRQIASRRIELVTLILIGLGILGTFPPVWALF